MDLTNSFEVARPIDEAWTVLTDVERIAPCLPGAQLQEIEGEEYRGVVKVKVGPITAQYKGAATFVEKDDNNYKAVLKGDGRDTRGAGNASALITASLEPVNDATTKVNVDTDLTVTGKVAQFGRGVMADVSAKLMDQFANNLEEMLEEDGGADSGDADVATETATAEPASANGQSADTVEGVRRIDAPDVEAVDLLDAAGAPVAKRVVPIIGLIVALLILRRILRK